MTGHHAHFVMFTQYYANICQLALNTKANMRLMGISFFFLQEVGFHSFDLTVTLNEK